MEHWGLLTYLPVVSGADEHDRDGSKSAVILRALERLRERGADVSRAIHVGDRRHDVEGAAQAGLECIGALWGYGDAAELAGARWLAHDPADVGIFLGLED